MFICWKMIFAKAQKRINATNWRTLQRNNQLLISDYANVVCIYTITMACAKELLYLSISRKIVTDWKFVFSQSRKFKALARYMLKLIYFPNVFEFYLIINCYGAPITCTILQIFPYKCTWLNNIWKLYIFRVNSINSFFFFFNILRLRLQY